MLRRIYALAALSLAVLAPAPAGAHAAGPLAHRAIVGGQTISITAAPWQVDVWSEDDTSVSDCGGAILDASTVLTAAHCVDGTTPGNAATKGGLAVWAGTSSISSKTATSADRRALQERLVSSAQVHPGWRGRGKLATTGDLALLHLANPLQLDGRRVAAIALPGELPVPVAEPFSVGPQLTVSGYGITSGGGSTDGRLRALQIGVADPDACDDPDNAIELCATTPAGSACSGDSGGPVVSNGPTGPVLVGVVSNGPRSCPHGGANRYVSLIVPENLAFLKGSGAPPTAPRWTGDARFVGRSATPRVGDTLTCDGGVFTGGGLQHTLVTTDDGTVVLLATGRTATVQLTADLVGRRVRCRGSASSAGGIALSNLVVTGAAVAESATAANAGTCPAQPRTASLTVTAPARGKVGGRIVVSAALPAPSTAAHAAVLLVKRAARGAGTLRRVRTLTSHGTATVRATYQLPRSLPAGRSYAFQVLVATFATRAAADRATGLRGACDAGEGSFRLRVVR